MENRQKIKIVFTVASLAVVSIFFTVWYGKRRRQKLRSSSCYLHMDVKPQHSFKRSLADNSYAPFRHLKRIQSDDNNSANSHPYEPEIMDCLSNPPVDITKITNIKTLAEAYIWVVTDTQLKELADVLAKETVFSVDTEQHSLHSFLGFTALMQISTSEEDYLIDTIALHDVMGILCPVFSNPSICKVFHGADNDVLWLQRDFHIYVVNLFDTAKACDVLSKPARSLAYLLETYCNVNTNKLLQREDWRQRPLSTEMVQYARTDAHYLLYIANCLIVELKQHSDESSGGGGEKMDFVHEAYRRSNMTCLQLYGKDMEASPGESAALSIISRYGESSNQFQNIVRRLCAWREIMARVHDESLRFVLSDQAIVSLAEKMPVNPVDVFEAIIRADLSIESSSSSFPSPSPIICSHMENLCQLFEEIENPNSDIFSTSLQKCLGENGSCPLSIFNFPLLVHSTVKLTNKTVSRQNGSRRSRQLARKTSRQLFVQKFSCKSPVYHNCRIYADDGRLLCYCDRRKLEWYVRRNLAKVVETDPPAIMLLFEPKGRPEDEDNDFYIQSKKNICVGCGEGNHYLRYRIIPSCYRMHFPEHLKSHRSHDIVLVCVDCHEAAHAAAEKYKRKIALEFGIPLFVRNIVGSNNAQDMSEKSSLGIEFEQSGVSPLELRTAAMALIRHGQRMPHKRREELTAIVKRFYGGREISDEDLEKALLVGMSSYERRRFKKKRPELSLKYVKVDVPPDNDQKVGNETEQSLAALDDSVVEQESHASDEAENSVDCVENGTYIADTADTHVESGVENVDVVSVPDNTKQVARAGHNSKLSLLGHGPHGRQVVDRILEEQGEEGIRDFCQRWRQVFVEAAHPRFLPGGWDVHHSGRRDFGEFSVYNPVKKETIASTDPSVAAGIELLVEDGQQ